MIYIFDKTQAIIKVLTNDDFTAAHLNFKINTATTFEFSLPASKALPSGSKYVATPHPLNDSKFIMLRLTERVDNTETIDYSAYELAYQELATDGYIEDKRPQNQSALNLMKIALDGSNWELNNVNVSGTATTNFYYVDRLSAISNVVDLLGGEIVFYIEIQGNAIRGRYMDYLARQGADTSKVFSSGSNLLTVERQSDTSNIYTAILPRGKGEEIDNGVADTPDGYGRRINISDVEWKKSEGSPLDKPKGSIVLSDPDATAEWGQINGNARLLLQTYDDIDDVNVLINSAYKTLQSVNHPQIQYSATVADVGGLSLGDTVLIMHGDRNLSYKTRVFEVKYDLLEPDQTELSLGDDLSSNSITSQINNLNAVADTTSSQTQWTINQIGRPGTTYGETAPDSPKVGDIWFKYLADGGTEIYRWNGDIWELLASPTTAGDIAAAVTDAVTQAKTNTEDAIKQNNDLQQEVMNDIAKEQADLAIKDGDFNAKAQAMADKALSDAKANTATVAQETLDSANQNLSAAKTDLTNSIASEASARNAAVAAVNSQAQTYANQAKADALNAVNKEASDRVAAVGALDTKATNAVNQAKSDINATINATINAISVGGRNLYLNSRLLTDDYDLNGPVKITVEPFDSTTNMWHIVAAQGIGPNTGVYRWNFFGQKIPNNSDWTYSVDIKGTGTPMKLGIELGNKQPIKGNIGSEWSRISQTGHINNDAKTIVMYFDTSNSPLDVYIKLPKLEIGTVPTDWTQAPEDVVLDYTTKDNQIKETITQYQTTNDGKVIKAQTDATTALGQVATKVSQTDYDQKTGDLTTKYTEVKQTVDSQATDIVSIKATATSQASKINTISSDVDGTKQSISNIEKTQDSQSDKINQITTDVNGTKQSITDIQTKDGNQDTRMANIETSVSGVKNDFSSYKTTNDGAVKTAQTTAQTAVDGLKNKVSQTDYDKKTGQLQTDLTSTTQTANKASTDIVSIQQKDGDQDARMTQIESDASGVKTTVSDLQTAQGKQSGDISTLQQRADGFDATVTKINNLAVGGRNLYLNSRELTNRYDGNVIASGTITVTVEPFDSTTNMLHLVTSQGSGDRTGIYFCNYATGKIPNNSDWAYSADVKGTGKVVYFGIEDSDKNPVKGNVGSDWSRISQTGHVDSPNYKTIIMYFDTTDSPLDVYIKLPKLETGILATDWTPAPEDTDNKISTVSQNLDSITQIVSDPATGLSTRVQTAEGALSKVQGTDIPALQNATFWQPYSSLNFNDYTKQGSFFFNTTSAKTNGPITANSWVYLIVDQGTSDNTRIKQTAWYDGVTGVKITYVRTLNSGTWSPWYANDNDSVTTISQTNESIKTEISNRQTGDTNTLTQAKDFTSSQISNSETNMKSLINQKADSTIVGVIKDDVTSLKSNVNWQLWAYDDLNYLKDSGNYLITSGSGTNSPFTPWFYIKVDAPKTDRVTQTVWKDLDGTLMYRRTYNGSSWSSWTQMVMSSTLLSIFHDSWSLGTSTNDGITKQMITGIMGQPDGTLILKGNSLILDGNTTVTGAFKVSQANIANGAIGTAQIGDAAITSAKIADLDVSKITGNVTNFIQSYWNGVYGSTTMNSNGLSVQSGSMTTLFDSSGAHFAQGTRTAQYSFGNWIDNTGAATSAVGLYMGLRGDGNSFIDIVGPSGAAVAVIAGWDMADGANTNNVRGAINLFADTNIRSKLLFKGNDTVTSTYIEADEIRRTMNFYTDNAKNGDGNWFWFNHKVLSTGTFSSTSLLSKKNVIADYEEDALSEISKTDIVEFEYKNDVGEKHISPIIDDVNDEKDYYIPKTILGQDEEYVDMYSMISMAWKAIKQLNEKIGEK